MKKTCLLFFIILSLASVSCEKKQTPKKHIESFNDYTLLISTFYYDYNLQSGEFKIKGYNFSDTIALSKFQKERIEIIFFKYDIYSLKGEKSVLPEKNVIMPDPRNEIIIKVKDFQKSKLIISDQYQLSEYNHIGNNIFKFNKELFEILNKNNHYKNCMDTLKIVQKKLPPTL